MLSRNFDEAFVVGVARFFAAVFLLVKVHVFFVGVFKELFGVVSPCAVMVFVKNHQVPHGGVDKLVLRLDCARIRGAEQILKRTEHHNGPLLVRFAVLVVNGLILRLCIFIGNELPTGKVHMREQIFAPRGFHGGLEREHQHALCAHLFGKLIGRKGFAKAHFRVPKELRRAVRVVLLCRNIIVHGALHGGSLFRAHAKSRGAGTLQTNAGFQLVHGGDDIFDGAVEPFVVAVGVQLSESVAFQKAVNVLIGKAGAIGPHGGILKQNVERLVRGADLLFDARHHVAAGVADFDIALVERRLR